MDLPHPRGVMGPVGLSAGSITDGTETSFWMPLPQAGGEDKLPTRSEPVGNRRREKEATIQCLKCTFGAGISTKAQREGAGIGEGGRRERSQKQSLGRGSIREGGARLRQAGENCSWEGHTKGRETRDVRLKRGGLCHCGRCRVGVGWRVWAEAGAQRPPDPELPPFHSSPSGLPGGVTSLGTLQHPYSSQATCSGERDERVPGLVSSYNRPV